MKTAINHLISLQYITGLIAGMLILTFSSFSYGHGGKAHSSESITALSALQKAYVIYDQLIGKKKLEQSWENDLIKVEIQKRSKQEKVDFIVAFHRSKGEKKTVYIYLTAKGKYAGSNYDGK